eukprot:CAMPEP_0119197622 /NCGR_PEP_ID=MMETSP1316-20130426/14936_1 /TAXON_ID=41880 /ORGANISM="Pycnococcus provasolii, Strain RCC2336" /LENGTH=43 /DNA_ID= /DNA_START= /DNA_END= /DNA_ORIENTATION=
MASENAAAILLPGLADGVAFMPSLVFVDELAFPPSAAASPEDP